MWRFRRFRLLLVIAVLAALAALPVIYASPYAPVVQPVREIEEIWAIEDARQESEAPLLTALENNGVALGYDAYENTFYCALGLENGEEWPDIHLTAPGAKDIEICFVDDYAFDWCQDAIREGYAYQIIAYNDEVFSYAQVVFTGLPILQMTTQEEIQNHVDIPVEAAWSYDADSGMYAHGRTHKRGGWTLTYNEMKNGLKLEFTRRSDGTGKVQMPLEGMGMADGLVLIPCLSDQMLLRERLCWDLYGMLEDGEQPFGRPQMSYTELFINNEYQGIYLALKPYDYEAELRKVSAEAAEADSVYRTLAVTPGEENQRPIYDEDAGWSYEVFYTTRPAGREFEALEELAAIFSNRSEAYAQDDEAFCRAVLETVDLDSLIEYALYIQACGLHDNVKNNMYVWARKTDTGYQYRFFPWDLDYSFDAYFENYEDVKWVSMPLLERAIELDCGDVIRSKVRETWERLRATVFNEETITALTEQCAYELSESGAFFREAQRWGREVSYPDGYNTIACAGLRLEMADRRIDEMTSEAWRGQRLQITETETTVVGELPGYAP